MGAGEDFRREFARQMFPGADIVEFSVKAMTYCDCGCGLPDRIEVKIGNVVLGINDAVQVDELIDMLAEGRRKLWGPRPKKVEGS